MTAVAWLVLTLCAAVCLLVYAGYPLVLLLVGRLRPRPIRRAAIRPPLTVIVPVFNEESLIGAKLANTLAQSYPADRLQVVVVSDGSTDATADIVRTAADPRLLLIERTREGKLPALAAGVAAASGEIVAFTDANTLLLPDALAALVEPFADPEVGGVCGRKRYRTGERDDATGTGESAYWGFDTWLKDLESRVGSVFAADGALYALRRELFVAPADPAQADDIAISARVVLQGRRLVTEPRAVASEPAPTEGRLEFARKVRVTNHSVRALLLLGGALWTSGFYSFELVVHKLLRHLIPFFLLPMLAASAFLAPRFAVARWTLAGQLAVYGLGLLGFLLRRARLGRFRPFALPYYFGLANAAALVGVLSILRGRRHAVWIPRAGDALADPDSGDLDPMRKILVTLVTTALLATASGLAAQEDPTLLDELAPAPAASDTRWEVGLGATFFDNFFQAPDGSEEQNVRAAAARLGGETRIGASRLFTLFGDVEHLEYDEDLDNSTRFTAGFRRDGQRHDWDVHAVWDRNRPSFDVGDEFDRADGLRLVVDTSSALTNAFALGVTGEIGSQSFDLRPDKDSDLASAGPYIRLEGWDSKLSTELGYRTGSREVDDPVDDYDEDTLYLTLRFAPTSRWYGSLRYRDRDREYTFDDPASSNLGRQDDRRDWTLGLSTDLTRRFEWNLYANALDADSTKPSRIFESSSVATWVSYQF